MVLDGYAGGRTALCACLSELGCEALGAPADITHREVEWCRFVDVMVIRHAPPFHDGVPLVAAVRRRAPRLPVILVADPRTGCADVLTDDITRVEPCSLEALAHALGLLARGPHLAC